MTQPNSTAAVGTVPITREQAYRDLLVRFFVEPSESVRREAYELGRAFLHQGVTLVELASIHHDALSDLLDEHFYQNSAGTLGAASEFLSEVLSAYEMAQRGFSEAIAALRGMNEVLEEEIKRIAFAIHNDSSQLLVAVHLALADLASKSPENRPSIENLAAMLKTMERQLRQFSHDLRPMALHDLGLMPALRSFAGALSKQLNVPIQIVDQISGRLPAVTETVAYRVIQEATTNAARHANANLVSVEVSALDSRLSCSVRDDGIGFSIPTSQTQSARRGLGLLAMRERINAAGGSIQFKSTPGEGTEVCFTLPLPKEHAVEDSNSRLIG